MKTLQIFHQNLTRHALDGTWTHPLKPSFSIGDCRCPQHQLWKQPAPWQSSRFLLKSSFDLQEMRRCCWWKKFNRTTQKRDAKVPVCCYGCPTQKIWRCFSHGFLHLLQEPHPPAWCSQLSPRNTFLFFWGHNFQIFGAPTGIPTPKIKILLWKNRC